MPKKNRTALRQYFQTGNTPTQDQFAELIDSGVNLLEDGVTVDAAGRLAIGASAPTAHLSVQGAFDQPLTGTVAIAEGIGVAPTSAVATGMDTDFLSELAVGEQFKIGLLAFTVSAIASDISMTVEPAPASAVPASTALRRGPLLAITDAADVSQLLVDAKGDVGIGTATPSDKLEVAGNVKALGFRGDGSEVTNLDASKITAGTIDPARLPAVDSGPIDAARIPALDASKIATGTIDPARLPAMDSGPIDAARIPALDASKIATGTIDPARLPAVDSGPIDAARIPALDASKIATGKLSADVIPNLDASLITSGYLSPDRLAPRPNWQATIARPGGATNNARCLADSANFVHFSGSVDPIYSVEDGGTKDLLRVPVPCVPAQPRSFAVLDNYGEPWRLDIPAAADQSASAIYLGKADVPSGRSLYLAGISYYHGADQSNWLAAISRPDGNPNSVKCQLDVSGFVHLDGAVTPAFSLLVSGADDLLQIPAPCTPGTGRSFVILDDVGEPWRLDIPAAAGQSVSARYLGETPNPVGRNLNLTGLSYTIATS
jgi:hypothetical protein